MDGPPRREQWPERLVRQLPYSIGFGAVTAVVGYLWAETSNASDRYLFMGLGVVSVVLGSLLYAVALWFKTDSGDDSTASGE